MKILLAILLFLSVVFAVPSCRQQSEEEENSATAEVTVTVRTALVTEGDAINSIVAFGKTDALRKEKIYAPLAGRITVLNVFEGTEVKKGDLIAVIQTKESQAAILGAETMLRSATTSQQKAEAERVLQLARSTQHSVNVVATFDGFVSTRAVSEGELVTENAELVTVVDLTTINFLADVHLEDLSTVRPSQSATIQFQTITGKAFSASVDAISPQTDVSSQTVKVRLRFLAMPSTLRSLLRTEMVGTATVQTGVRHNALFVPKSALLRNDEENTYAIVTITPDSLALKIPVSVGVITGTAAEIRSPRIRNGMTVITEGNYSLADSTHVKVAPDSPE